MRVHPFPFRTRKLSSPVPTILVWRRTGKIGQCQHGRPQSFDCGLLLFRRVFYAVIISFVCVMGGVRCAGSVLSAAQAAKAACGSFCHCVCADTLPAAAGADRISPVSSAWDSASGWLCSDGFGMLSSTARTAGRTGALCGSNSGR